MFKRFQRFSLRLCSISLPAYQIARQVGVEEKCRPQVTFNSPPYTLLSCVSLYLCQRGAEGLTRFVGAPPNSLPMIVALIGRSWGRNQLAISETELKSDQMTIGQCRSPEIISSKQFTLVSDNRDVVNSFVLYFKRTRKVIIRQWALSGRAGAQIDN